MIYNKISIKSVIGVYKIEIVGIVIEDNIDVFFSVVFVEYFGFV